MKLRTLGSSSRGNCYILTDDNGKSLILECGIDFREVKRALDYKLDGIVGCLLTHEHKDHSRYAKDVIRAGIDIYMTAGTAGILNLSGHRVHIVKSEQPVKFGGLTVLPFETKHDCAEPVGYLIAWPGFGKILFATDTYYIPFRFSGLNLIMCECNYSEKILEENLKNGVIIKPLENRVVHSHFSLENFKGFLEANDLSHVSAIVLLHLSDDNSDEKLFKETVEGLTGVTTYIASHRSHRQGGLTAEFISLPR